MLDIREFGADPAEARAATARGRGRASLVLLVAPPPASLSPALRIVVHEAILEAPAIAAAARDPGPPAPLLPALPARDARRVRDLLATRDVRAEVVPADGWRRAILTCGSSGRDISEALERAAEFAARAGFRASEQPGLAAVLRESLANAAHHGNRDDPSRAVRLDMTFREGRVAFSVEDEGEGFDYERAERELAAKGAVERAAERLAAGGRGGLGLLMIRRWATSVQWENGGRRIRVVR